MLSKKLFLFASFIFVWTIVTYLFLLRQQDDFNIYSNKFKEKVEYLEINSKSELNTNNNLMKKFINILKIKNNIDNSQREQTVQKPQQDPVVGFVDQHQQPSSIRQDDQQQLRQQQNEIVNSIDNPLDFKNISLSSLSKPINVYPILPILVIACNRISITKCLDNLLDYRPNPEQFPIIVSQDCDDEATRNIILSYKEVNLIQQPDQSDIPVPPISKKFKGYYKIARHYGWALNTIFDKGFEYVIIVEDDLNIAPDFYEYFLATYSLLKNDPTLWCISAWNDNGKPDIIDESRPDLLYRTDFFPGLGWMLTKNLWNELSPKWPQGFWDDWIRAPEQRLNRSCIRPEISRTKTFGKLGVSNGLFFDKHLTFIKLNTEPVNFTKYNLTYLTKSYYDTTFLPQVYQAPIVTFEELYRGILSTKDPVRIQYSTKEQFKRNAKLLGLMDDFKSGVPRTAYHGIVSCFYKSQRVYLTPNINWNGYDPSWS